MIIVLQLKLLRKGCFRKATLEIKIPQIDYEGQLCDKHFEKLEKLETNEIDEFYACAYWE